MEVDEYMTLEEAAVKIGYKDTSGLRHAIRRGVLRAVQRGKMYFTTQQWLDEYVAHVAANRGGRGKTRKPRASEEPS